MSSARRLSFKTLFIVVALLLGIIFSLHFFPIECAFATEERIHPSEMDFSDAGMNPAIGYALLTVLLITAIPSIAYAVRLKEQKKLQLSGNIEIEGKAVRIINSDKDAVERAHKLAKPGPGTALVFTALTVCGVVLSSFIVPSYPINITNFWIPLLAWIGAAALYSTYLLTKDAHALIFDDGKIWYRTHMSIKPNEFSITDIDFIEEQGIDYTLHLKCGKIKKLYWLSYPPELKEYLIEQGIPTKDKG